MVNLWIILRLMNYTVTIKELISYINIHEYLRTTCIRMCKVNKVMIVVPCSFVSSMEGFPSCNSHCSCCCSKSPCSGGRNPMWSQWSRYSEFIQIVYQDLLTDSLTQRQTQHKCGASIIRLSSSGKPPLSHSEPWDNTDTRALWPLRGRGLTPWKRSPRSPW